MSYDIMTVFVLVEEIKLKLKGEYQYLILLKVILELSYIHDNPISITFNHKKYVKKVV